MLNLVLALLMALQPIVVKLYPEGNQPAPVKSLLVFTYVERNEKNRSVECLLYQDDQIVAGSTALYQGKDDTRTLFTFEYKDLAAGRYYAIITVTKEDWTETAQKSAELRVE